MMEIDLKQFFKSLDDAALERTIDNLEEQLNILKDEKKEREKNKV